jgi:hypothetical protein
MVSLPAVFRSSPASSCSAGIWSARQPKWQPSVRLLNLFLKLLRFVLLTYADLAGTAYLIQPVVFTWANKVLARDGDDAARAVILYAMNG